MKITIDLEDLLEDIIDSSNEGDGAPSLSEAVIADVKYQTKKEVWKAIGEGAKDKTLEIVKRAVDAEMDIRINQRVQDTLEKAEINSPYGMFEEGRTCSVEEYVNHVFRRRELSNKIDKHLEKLADNFAKETKNSYDMMFASQIVLKMSEQGLLKDGVVEQFLEKKSE